jgi:hypothetical protein
MQAIEFEAQLENGVIRLPLPYQDWHAGQRVRVIVLTGDNQTENTAADKPTDQDVNRHAGKITLTQDPLAFQSAMRDEWP